MNVFICPVKNPRLTSKYSLARKHPSLKDTTRMHAGIDLVGNATIMAAAAGKVRLIKDMGKTGYGKYVIITHHIGDQVYETVYAHLKSISVKVGQVLKQGDTVGIMGNTGIGTGIHLHFEIHRGTYDYAGGTYPKSINPEPIVLPDFNMHISKTGLDLIKKYEGFYENAYVCPAGVMTIGWGTTKWPHAVDGKVVKKGEKISRAEADFILEQQVNEHAQQLWKYIKVPLTQNQFDALASFAYNLGANILAKDAALTSYINKKDWANTTRVMLMYIKAAGKKLDGLEKRRKDEVALFSNGTSVPNEGDERVFKYSSTSLQAEHEVTRDSAARRKIIVEAAIAAGYNEVHWRKKLEDGTVTADDADALAAGTLVKLAATKK